MWRRYAFVRQTDGSACGAAALAMIALHHRRHLGLPQVRDLAGTDRAGTNLLGLMRAAEHLGFSARGVKGTYEALALAPLPAVPDFELDLSRARSAEHFAQRFAEAVPRADRAPTE